MEITQETLNNLYWEQKLSTLTIGRQYGVSSTTVISKMKELGIRRRTPGEYLKGCHMCLETRRKISESQRGDKKKNWKGGRHIDANGYVRVVIRLDDFFFPMAHRKGRVLEHRLVMAKHLGRNLHRWEIVHHKEGIAKDDNRIEGLQLVSDDRHKQITTLEMQIQKLKEENKRLLQLLKDNGFGDCSCC